MCTQDAGARLGRHTDVPSEPVRQADVRSEGTAKRREDRPATAEGGRQYPMHHSSIPLHFFISFNDSKQRALSLAVTQPLRLPGMLHITPKLYSRLAVPLPG